jgi:nucleoside-diphosphate-sugar epimerase
LKRIVLTGALGFIGSVLTHYLLDKMPDYHLILVDRMKFESDSNFFYTIVKNTNVTFVKGDIRNIRLMDVLIRESDAVVNLAALVGEPLCKQQPEETIQVNEQAATMLADLTMRRGAKYIFTSTASNYGQSPNHAAREEDPLYPESLYAISKTRTEQYIVENIPNAIILRCATAYGLSPRTRFDILPNEFIKDALLKKAISIFSPEVHRPIVHVQDIAQAIFLALDAPAERNTRIYNVGSANQNYTKGQIADIVAKHMNVPVNIEEGRVDPRDYIVDFNKIAMELGFKCKYGIDDGIDEIKTAIETEAITAEELDANVNVIAMRK